MAQQTAVEWLAEKTAELGYVSSNILEQAKAMEKEQITQAHLLGLIRSLEMEATKQAEQYYNETYNLHKNTP
jgi:hypothetical protein